MGGFVFGQVDSLVDNDKPQFGPLLEDVIEENETEAPSFQVPLFRIGGANIHGALRSANYFSPHYSANYICYSKDSYHNKPILIPLMASIK